MVAAGQPAAAEPERPLDRVERTFGDIVRANQSMVFSIAYHFLRNRAAAEEVAQDVFLRLYRSFGDLENETHVAFWLRKATSNRSIDYARKRKSQSAVALDQAPEPAAPAGHGDPLL